jgi:thiamine-phosphate pyrophosphorylase
MSGRLQLYYITDRTQIKSSALDACIERAVDAGVVWVQIREKDLPARTLLTITQAAAGHARERNQARARVMVNDRLDVALAGAAHGVHLGTRSMPTSAVRRVVPPEFLVGLSCHSLQEALSAQAAGVDYLLLGPVFETPSKLRYGSPLGTDTLREVTLRVTVPVFALGGMTVGRVGICLDNGAAGIAGVRIFQDCERLEDRVRELRAQFPA